MKTATELAQQIADQELEACCTWMRDNGYWRGANDLHASRCPKPPSLAEEALVELNLTSDCMGAIVSPTQVELIRRALERLQQLENNQ